MNSRFLRTYRICAGTALAMALCTPALAADYYLKLGDIKGETTRRGVSGQIEVQSFHWSTPLPASEANLNSSKSNLNSEIAVSDPGAPKDPKGIAVHDPGADGPKNPKRVASADLDGDGRPDAARTVDKASPLLAAAKLAKPLEQGSVVLVIAAGACSVGASYPIAELTTPAYKYEFRDVVITSCTKASDGSSPLEEISFNYSQVRESPTLSSTK